MRYPCICKAYVVHCSKVYTKHTSESNSTQLNGMEPDSGILRSCIHIEAYIKSETFKIFKKNMKCVYCIYSRCRAQNRIHHTQPYHTTYLALIKHPPTHICMDRVEEFPLAFIVFKFHFIHHVYALCAHY